MGNSGEVDWLDAYWLFPLNQYTSGHFLADFTADFACVYIRCTTYYFLDKSVRTASTVCGFKNING